MTRYSDAPDAYHVPVLAEQTLRAAQLRPDELAVDCTTGGGGHSALTLEQLGAGGTLLCIDKDEDALQEALPRLQALAETRGVRLAWGQADFSQIEELLTAQALGKADVILADIGVSSHQLDESERGFSYMQDGPLDMRMDRSSGETAADLVNRRSQDELAAILRDYGEERYSKRIAERIVARRQTEPFTRTVDLAEVIRQALPAQARREQQHPAKRSFQALRIAVNQELQALDDLLKAAPRCLNPGGRLLVISFHSLEDRRVKQAMRKWEDPCECPPALPCVCGKKPLGRALGRSGYTANEEELAENPRARSARLRVFQFADSTIESMGGVS